MSPSSVFFVCLVKGCAIVFLASDKSCMLLSPEVRTKLQLWHLILSEVVSGSDKTEVVPPHFV